MSGVASDSLLLQAHFIADALRTCDQEHAGCGHRNKPVAEVFHVDHLMPKLPFRLLDVELGCVKDASLDARYVALSYVSPGPDMTFRLSKEQLERASADGFLTSIRPSLPRTISEAVDFVRALGERYLWVDALSIAHDDKHEMSRCARLMSSVYRRSHVTVVAASGPDANFGLVGSGNDVAHSQQPGQVHDLNWYLSQSTYGQRGWTLGEIVLSRRTAIFVAGRLFFSCPTSQRSHHAPSEALQPFRLVSQDGRVLDMPPPLSGLLPSLSAYLDLSEEYSRRKISNHGDALRAFGGISHILNAGMTGDVIHGLSDYLMDAMLLFTSCSGNLQRRSGFASYMWAGWEGEIRWPRETFVEWAPAGHNNEARRIARWLQHSTFLDWTTPKVRGRRSRGGEGAVDDIVEPLAGYITKHPDVFPIQIAEGCRGVGAAVLESVSDRPRRRAGMWLRLDDPLAAIDQDENGNKKIATPADAERPCKPKFSLTEFNAVNSIGEFNSLAALIYDPVAGPDCNVALHSWVAMRNCNLKKQKEKCERAKQETQELPAAERGDGKAPYPVLQAQTICLKLRLGQPLPNSGGELHDGKQTAPVYPLYGDSGRLVGSMHSDNSAAAAPADGAAVDLVIMALSQKAMRDSALLQDSRTANESNLIWVLHVDWHDGRAQRRGIGQLVASALVDAVQGNPVVRWVTLC